MCVFVYNSHQGNISLYCNLMLCNTFNTTLEIYCNYMHAYCQVCNCLIKDEIVTEIVFYFNMHNTAAVLKMSLIKVLCE